MPESARPESTLAKLTSMGFSPAACRDAVAVHPDHDLDKCVAWLLAAERSASVYDSDQASLSSSLGSSVRGSALAASPELARQGSALAGASGAKWSVSVQRLLMRDPRVMVNAHLAVSVMDSQGRVVHPVQVSQRATVSVNANVAHGEGRVEGGGGIVGIEGQCNAPDVVRGLVYVFGPLSFMQMHSRLSEPIRSLQCCPFIRGNTGIYSFYDYFRSPLRDRIERS